MPKFGTQDPDAEPEVSKPAMDQIPPATKGAAASIPSTYSSTTTFSSGPTSSAAVQQLSPEAQLAKIDLEKKQWEKESAKQDEHWAKAYWRPAMGWLYMLICLVDFVVFPAIAMFLPIVTKLPYVAWQSLSLSNGGLIHMAFGAILGVAAYGRTQEKVASKQ
jgi:uncharacterized membrane protein